MKSYSDSYKAAGVDVTAGYKSVELMKEHVKRTNIPGVVSGIGGFGGLFQPDMTGMKEPVLVSGTDGVGTKLVAAMLLDKHDTIGIDCVAMCVNDVVCCGAKPLQQRKTPETRPNSRRQCLRRRACRQHSLSPYPRQMSQPKSARNKSSQSGRF